MCRRSVSCITKTAAGRCCVILPLRNTALSGFYGRDEPPWIGLIQPNLRIRFRVTGLRDGYLRPRLTEPPCFRSDCVCAGQIRRQSDNVSMKSGRGYGTWKTVAGPNADLDMISNGLASTIVNSVAIGFQVASRSPLNLMRSGL